MTDADLYLRWLARRDAAAFEVLVGRHADLVVDVAWRVAGDRAAAEDALEEALVSLAADGTERPAAVGVRAWLARAAIGRARNVRASDRARGRRQAAAARDAKEGAMRGPESRAEALERSACVQEALDRLEGEDAAVLTMKYLHGIEYPELAAILDVEEVTARVRVHRALERLREGTRRGDLCEGDLALGIAGAARATLGAERLAEIVRASLAGGTAATVPVAATVSGAVGAAGAAVAGAGRVRALVAAAGLCAVAAVGALTYARRAARTEPAPALESARGGAADKGTASEGAPALAGRRAAVDPRPGSAAPEAPRTDPVPPAPRPAAAVPHDRPIPEEPEPQVETELRLRLGETRETLRVVSVQGGGLVGLSDDARPHHALRLADGSVRVRVPPDSYLTVAIDDARFPLNFWVVRIPADVSTTLDLRLPDPADPRFAAPVLEFRDAKTGRPVPGVQVERTSPYGYGPLLPPVPADGDGHLRFDPSLGALSQALFVAPGYQPRTGPMAVSVAQREAWTQTGRLPIELEPIPGDVRPVSLRVLRADGTPLSDGLVRIAFPTWTSVPDLPLHPDAQGVVTSPVPRVFGVVVFDRGFPVGTFLMAKAAWTDGATRELRLPPMARVHLRLTGLAQDETLHLILATEAATVVDRGHMADHRLESGRNPDEAPDDIEALARAGAPPSAVTGHEATLSVPVGAEVLVQVWRRIESEEVLGVLRIRATDAQPLDLVRDWADLER